MTLIGISGVSYCSGGANGGVEDLIRIDFPAGGGPSGVCVGDFDLDGFADLAIVESSSRSVSVLLNDQHGIFAWRDIYPLPDGMSEPTAVVSGDLNGDGLSDLAVTIRDAGFGQSRLMVLTNAGTGGFVTTIYPVGWGASSLAIGDLDGDGDADLVTTNLVSRTMSRLFNDGQGGFNTVFTSVTAAMPRRVVLADIDQDGDLDFAISWLHGVLIRKNDGTGGFAASFGYSIGHRPRGMDFGDVDGDGDLDMVVADWGGDAVDVSLNDGTGFFEESTVYPVGDGPTDVLLRDLDGDGHEDLIIAAQYANEIEIRTNDQSGQFWRSTRRANGLAPSGIESADFDHDGVRDIAVTNLNGQSVSVYAKYLCEGDLNPDGIVDFFDLAMFLNAYGNGDPRSDLNGDGILDFYDLSLFLTMLSGGCA
ncbi:MAG: FG-GAP-like repeat-containing protein [Phycisphaerales bacterium]